MSRQNNNTSKRITPTGHKVTTVSYRDLSDFSRPIAIWIAQRLQTTNIHVYHVTVLHFLLTLLAACAIARGGVFAVLIGVILILVKNTLDAVDGSLARLRHRPSRVGRFLDSNLDFIGNSALFLVLLDIPVWMRLVSFLAFLLQGSFFNYYYILFRKQHGGDTTSKTQEDNTSSYTYDNPTALRILYMVYTVFYRWQDVLVAFIDRHIKQDNRTISPVLISSLSVNGLGFQYLAFIFFLLINQQVLIFWWFAVVMNVFLLALLVRINKIQR